MMLMIGIAQFFWMKLNTHCIQLLDVKPDNATLIANIGWAINNVHITFAIHGN